MKTRWTIFGVLLFITSELLAQPQAQGYAFKVLVSKGKAEMKSVDSWQNIKVGTALKDTDEIKIAEGSYLGLIHINGRPLEVRDAGSFKVKDLVSRLKPGTGVINKYTDFILSSQEVKKNRLAATGAVHRGIKDMIIVYLAETERAELYGDKIDLQWDPGTVAGPYEVIFTNLLEDRLAKFEVNENRLSVALNEGNLKGQNNLMVKVVSKANAGQGSKDYVIKRLSDQNREKYSKSVEELKGAVDEHSAMGQFVLAGYYEENYLINDAITAYQEAIKLAPDVAQYQEAYQAFLIRLGFEVK